MIKLERSPSHSWWWDSHNSPKHSRWLQSNLQDLDEKVKEMLKLIEEDADSFAQRAEMYYQKRPELINLVEEFYRAYRSLAERYDHLTGEIKHNIPRALQVQYGLSCDSPQGSAVGRQLHSPLRKSNQTFESLLKKAGQSEVQVQYETPGVGSDTCYEHKENGFSPDEGLTSSSDSEVDNLFAVQKLQQEVKSLEHEKTLHQKAVDRNQVRIKELEGENASLQEEAITLRNKVNELSKEVSNLQMENARQTDELSSRKPLANNLRERIAFSHENYGVIQEKDSERTEGSSNLKTGPYMVNGECRKFRGSSLQEESRNLDERLNKFSEENQRLGDAVKSAPEFQKSATMSLVSDLVQNNKTLRVDLPVNYAEETLKEPAVKLLGSKEENIGLENQSDNIRSIDEHGVLALKQKLQDLQGQLTVLVEENRIQKLAILDRAEEKREAIRQLCFSMDILKSKSQRLELALGYFKKKLSKPPNAVSADNLPAWKKVLLGAWKSSKTEPYALAL